MLPFHRILFPVDYSDANCALAPFVGEMASHFNAELTLVHAYGPDFLAYTELGWVYSTPDTNLNSSEKKRLHDFAREAFPGRQTDCIATLGEPGAVVQDVIRHQGTDLVMLPTHGRGIVRRFLLGSVAMKVLHDSSAAVWSATTAAMKRNPAHGRYKSILCAVDQTEEAEGVLRAAASLAAEFGAELRIVHAVEALIPPPDMDFSPYYKILKESADSRLWKLKDSLGIDAPHSVQYGPVAIALREEVISRKADLIVTGRGRSQDTFSGVLSRLYATISEAPCPVLSI